MERPTAVAWLSREPVEYRLERRRFVTVLVLHGGHTRAALAVGEKVFAEAGCTVAILMRQMISPDDHPELRRGHPPRLTPTL